MRIAAWLLVLGIAAGCQTMAPPEQKAEISGADAATSGTWFPVLAELGGQEYKLGQDFRLIVQGDRYEIAGAQRDSGRLIFYASTPKAFDVLGEVGPSQGLAIPAIYRFLPDGNMEICYDLSGTTRPTDFVTHPGTKLFRVVYKRR